jgi:casein kinase II subunit beta
MGFFLFNLLQMGSWVGWFCSIKGNEFFCEVDEDYIQDDFNLSGLSSQVPYYDYALELILDADSGQDEILTEAQQAAVEAAGESLYGLIHARFVLTTRGLAAMAEKFRSCDFGRCPRVLCNGQPCLPVGLSDQPRQSTVKLFCPRCEEAYYPRSKYHGNIDGAYFGTTFPHLFFLTYPQLKPQKPLSKYVPRVFGFKISPLAWSEDGNKEKTSRKEALGSRARLPTAATPAVTKVFERVVDAAEEKRKNAAAAVAAQMNGGNGSDKKENAVATAGKSSNAGTEEDGKGGGGGGGGGKSQQSKKSKK